MAHEAPEQMLDVFRAAALSVTKLYKSSISAQGKARADGYQDCLDDLLQFLDKEYLGLDDGEGWKIRAWANERLEGRDGSPHALESDDDAEKPEAMSSPEIHRSANIPAQQPRQQQQQQQQHQHQQPQQQHQQHQQQPQPPASRSETQVQPQPVIPMVQEIPIEEAEVVVPTQDTFDFRSSLQYPQDAQTQLNIANLRLSDARSTHSDNSIHCPGSTTISMRPSRSTRHGSGGRSGPRTTSSHLGRGAGSKRKVNFGEFFDLGNLGQSKVDGFGGSGAKRSRHN